MARTKKAVAKPVTKPEKVEVTLTEEQLSELRNIAELVSEARRLVDAIEDVSTLGSASYKAGRAYSILDKAEDQLDELVSILDSNLDFDFDVEDEDY